MNIHAELVESTADTIKVRVRLDELTGSETYDVIVDWPPECRPEGETRATLSAAQPEHHFFAVMEAQRDGDYPVTVTTYPTGQPDRQERIAYVIRRTSTESGRSHEWHPLPSVPAPPPPPGPEPEPGPLLTLDIRIRPPMPVPDEPFVATVEFDPQPGVEKYRLEIHYPTELDGKHSALVSVSPTLVGRLHHTFHGNTSSKARPGRTVVHAVAIPVDPRTGNDLKGLHIKGHTVVYILSGGEGGDPTLLNALKENFDDVVGGKLKGAVDSIASQLLASNTHGIRLLRAADPLAASRPRKLFWDTIRAATSALAFPTFQTFMDQFFCSQIGLVGNMRMPFSQVDTYLRLKAFTELFMLLKAGVVPGPTKPPSTPAPNPMQANGVPYTPLPHGLSSPDMPASAVLAQVMAARPYLQVVLQNNPDILNAADLDEICDRLRYPVLIELIWSYWHEESMMVQTLHAIRDRFQNRTRSAGRDPLAQLEMDPLRPLNNIFWGYVQDEQHRLGVRQRAYEYLHQYGIGLEGRAVGTLRPADTRKRFLQAFHTLLYQAVQFYRQADDTTVVANANNVLWVLKDLHLLLAEGAQNQFGDLPWNARLEMLMEQWILSRPEIQDFLRARRMVPYPEAWMGAVDSMKTLQGWNPTNVIHFRDLGTYGEQILLSVREGGVPGLGGWTRVTDPAEAAAFALAWRPEIEGYINAYRAVTGIDITQDPADPRFLAERDAAPSVHLRRRVGAGSGT